MVLPSFTKPCPEARNKAQTALAIAGAQGAAELGRHWQQGAAATLTVQVPRPAPMKFWAMARVRMGAMAVAFGIQHDLDLECVVHVTTRDRNLMALESELLGAHALGVRDILALTGDPLDALQRVVLVPSAAAATHLRETFERTWCVDGWRPPLTWRDALGVALGLAP